MLAVAAGVVVFYAALIIPAHHLAEVLGRSVGVGEYVRVALMATGPGTAAGAVGSGPERDSAVRRAAYGTREQQRRTQVTR
ncbi:MAG TPA: hypothetical protein VD813_14340 [Pseudonocardia sp.]|nr:hypothetical protein [Pseudonocardia sp.]